jgi:hypothetical protein
LIPFGENEQLSKAVDYLQDEQVKNQQLPHHPRVSLGDSRGMATFLMRSFWAPELEKIASKLWLLSTQSSSNVEPLHYNRINGREVIITEDPRLHLLWMHDRIFVKPLPAYLLSHQFWTKYLLEPLSPLGSRRKDIHSAVLGFIRTYDHLIQYEADFRIAKELHLIPEDMVWNHGFAKFQASLSKIEDQHVSGRYLYGEIRLTRLNFWSKILLHKWQYESVHKQYADWFSRFYEPVLFAFAIVFLALNAMQVAMSVEQVSASGWKQLWSVCRWFSILTMVLAAGTVLAFFLTLVGMLIRELVFASRDRIRKSKESKLRTGP